MLRLRKGFTLIELLVVIAVLGVLAVAVISSINPVEQINKARDAASKSDAAEYVNAIERFYATYNCYPWDYTTANKTCAGTPTQYSVVTIFESQTAITDKLIATNELKPEFKTRVATQTVADAVNVLMVSSTDPNVVGGPYLVHVCFKPSSKTFANQAKQDNVGEAANPGVDHCVPAL